MELHSALQKLQQPCVCVCVWSHFRGFKFYLYREGKLVSEIYVTGSRLFNIDDNNDNFNDPRRRRLIIASNYLLNLIFHNFQALFFYQACTVQR